MGPPPDGDCIFASPIIRYFEFHKQQRFYQKIVLCLSRSDSSRCPNWVLVDLQPRTGIYKDVSWRSLRSKQWGINYSYLRTVIVFHRRTHHFVSFDSLLPNSLDSWANSATFKKYVLGYVHSLWYFELDIQQRFHQKFVLMLVPQRFQSLPDLGSCRFTTKNWDIQRSFMTHSWLMTMKDDLFIFKNSHSLSRLNTLVYLVWFVVAKLLEFSVMFIRLKHFSFENPEMFIRWKHASVCASPLKPSIYSY